MDYFGWSILFLCKLWIVNPLSYSFSQNGHLTGGVSDELTKKPLPYVHVYVKDRPIGVYSNEMGRFELHHLMDGDTIEISSLGYHKQKIKYGKDTSGEVLLAPKSYALTPASVRSGTPVDEEYGFTRGQIDENKISGVAYGLRLDQKEKNLLPTNYQMAVQFRNERNSVGTIKNVAVYLHPGGAKGVPFRLRLYEVDSTDSPGENLLRENVILSGKKAGWIHVDLERYYLDLPQKGFFVSLEWLPTNDEANWYTINQKMQLSKDAWRKRRKYFKKSADPIIGYGHMVGVYDSSSKKEVWRKSISENWNKNYFDYELMVKCKIRVWE